MADEPQQLADQLATLIQSGLPLAPALRATAEELPDRRLAACFERLAAELEAGRSLEESLAADSRIVPPHLRQLISAGAKSGKLADVLVRFVDIDRSWIDLGRGIRLALAYPIVLLSLLALLAVALELLIVPNFAKIYGDFRAPLPFPTKAMVWLSGQRMVELVGITAGALIIVPLLARLLLPAAFRRRLVMRIPLFGPVVRWRGVTLWARLMELLLNEGTRVPEALQLAAGGVNDASLAAESMRLSRLTASGQKLGDAIVMSRRIPASLVPIVRWGEDTGALVEAFRTAGDMCENRAQSRAAVLQSSLPPIVFVIVALGALFLLNSLMMPILNLMRGITTLCG